MHLSQRLYKFAKRSYRLQKIYLNYIYSRLAPETAVVSTGTGHQIRLHPRYDYVQRELFLSVQQTNYERHVTDWLKRNIETGATAIDVGAHIGYYAVLISSLIGSNGNALFIEPLPEHYKALRDNLETNGFSSTRAIQLAVSDTNGQADFFPASDSGRNSLRYNEVTDRKPIRIITITLDDLLEKFSIDMVDLLQLDVEGAECLIFKGGHSVLTSGRIRTVLCEYHPDQLMQSFGVKPADFIDTVVAAGFEIFSLDAKTSDEIEFSREKINSYQHLVFRWRRYL